MFVLEESQLLEDTIGNKATLALYNNLKKHESSSLRDDLLVNLSSEQFAIVLKIVLELPDTSNDKKISHERRESIIQKLGGDKNDAASLVLIVAGTLTQLFVIDNFSGPQNKKYLLNTEHSELFKELEEKYGTHSLTMDGCEAYHLMTNPWLLKATQICWYLLENLGVSRRLLELEFLVWRHRFITIYMSVLHEEPETLLKDLRKIQEFIFDHHIINDLRENKTQLVRFDPVELCCELIQSSLLRDGFTSARKIYDFISEESSISIEHTGVLGKRTRFQQNNIPQLVVKVSSDSKDDIGDERRFTPDIEGLPKAISLDDDTLLPDISFVNEAGDALSSKQELNVHSQLLMLTRLDYILKTEVMEESLKDEWSLAYLRSIIGAANIWSVKYKALAHRSVIEKKQMRKMDRALLQLEELIKEADKQASENEDELRLKAFYSVLPNSKWQMQRTLGDISFDLCLYKNALEIYTRIEYWEGIIKCHSALGETTKAELVIRQELSKQETPYLYCLLGDATEELKYYEKSWELSGSRYARAKKSIGTYHYVRKNYAEAIEHYELALKASPSNVSILSMLAYSCLLLERYERAAECYRNITYQDDTNFLAWNNLSKAYIKLNQKERAWRTLREAIKCNYEEPKIWENFMLVAVEIGALDDVITAWHRIIEIRGSHQDDQILSALTFNLIKKSLVTNESEFLKLFSESIKLVARISTTGASSPRVWLCYFRLLIRQHEMAMQDSKKNAKDASSSMELNAVISKMKNCLQRATPTAVISDANWYQSLDKIDKILDSFDELIDCYDLAFNTLGRRPEIWSQWKYFKLSLGNTMKTLRQKGYDNNMR